MVDSDSAASPEAEGLLDGFTPAEWFRARKVRPVWGRLQASAGVVQTLEGPVRIEAGEYLCRGEIDEIWPQTASELQQRYYPTGTLSEDGWQQFLPRPDAPGVLASQIHQAFRVHSRHGLLNGKAGDFLVRDDGSVAGGIPDSWVVDRDVFLKTYERL